MTRRQKNKSHKEDALPKKAKNNSEDSANPATVDKVTFVNLFYGLFLKVVLMIFSVADS